MRAPFCDGAERDASRASAYCVPHRLPPFWGDTHRMLPDDISRVLSSARRRVLGTAAIKKFASCRTFLRFRFQKCMILRLYCA